MVTRSTHLPQSPSQTVGPFFHPALGAANDLTREGAQGQRIIIRGQVLDGDGAPVPDALVEIWQADHQGIYPHPNDPRHTQADPYFSGFGRSYTVEGFTFTTIKPGPVPWEGDRVQAPHITVRVFARGMLLHVVTRLYFEGEPANTDDPVLSQIEDPARRQTLIASRLPTPDLPAYRFDIHLQGERETVFFTP